MSLDWDVVVTDRLHLRSLRGAVDHLADELRAIPPDLGRADVVRRQPGRVEVEFTGRLRALRPLFSTESWAPKLANYAFYSNPVVDDSIAKALLTTDGGERAALYKTAQEQIAKDLPRIPLVTEEVLYAHSKRLSGVYVMPDGNINSDEISLK